MKKMVIFSHAQQSARQRRTLKAFSIFIKYCPPTTDQVSACYSFQNLSYKCSKWVYNYRCSKWVHPIPY